LLEVYHRKTGDMGVQTRSRETKKEKEMQGGRETKRKKRKSKRVGEKTERQSLPSSTVSPERLRRQGTILLSASVYF